MKVGQIQEGMYSDGTVIFVKCPECGNETGDMGNDVGCEECGTLMPSAQNLDAETKAEWGIED